MSHVVRYAPRGKPEVVLEVDESRDPFELCAQVAKSLGLPEDTEASRVAFAEMKASRSKRHEEVAAGSCAPVGPLVARGESDDRRRRGDQDGASVPRAQDEARARREAPDDRGARDVAGRTDASRSDGLPVGMGASGVRKTSVDAYAKARAAGKLTTQQTVIADWLQKQIGDATRQEIARGTGLGINAVAGRCRELLDAGVLLETKQRKCKVTSETAFGLRLA
ncbi:MAG: hypothetical protein KGL39_44280 [Patescibacteria group bacterium]|nr:hypothetical protein [Patescibacteria group bacterium]